MGIGKHSEKMYQWLQVGIKPVYTQSTSPEQQGHCQVLQKSQEKLGERDIKFQEYAISDSSRAQSQKGGKDKKVSVG